MEIIINIPEDIYGRCREYRLHCGEAALLEDAVANGIPLLSKENTDGDLISRKVVLDKLQENHDFYKGATNPTDKARRDELLNVMCWVEELPIYSVEHTAEWKLIDAYRFLYDCSNCGQQSINKYPYCPNCGAKMKGEQTK